MAKTTNKPAHEIRLGTIKATIWKQPGTNKKVYYNVTVARIFKDGDEWKTTQSFGRDDLPKLELCIKKAYEWILTAGSSDDEKES